MRFSTKAKRAPGVSLAGSGAHAERKKGSGSTAQPSATHGTIAERKKGSGSSAQVFLGDAAASKDPRQQSQMRFSNEKRGPGVSLADDGIVAERKKGSGWSAQVGDTWLSKDVFTIALVCEQGSADACIGVVGRNFFAQNWNVPLQECSHAAVLELATGKLYNKGQAVPRVLPRGPVGDGERFNLVVDMMEREMKIERLATIEGLEEVVASVSIERLPIEVALCVGFGGQKPQRVRVISSEMRKSEFGHSRKVHKDLWDDDNKITLLDSYECKSEAQKVRDAEISAAQSGSSGL